jgi:hypothetical protein
MRASRLAYDAAPSRVQRVIARPHTDTHVIVSHDGLVAFRGTHSARALLRVVKASSTEAPLRLAVREDSALVNAAVFRMFESVEGELALVLDGLPAATFCGHSLGGSVASLAAAYFGSVGPTACNVTCHTFGAPKCGDAAFYEWRDRRACQAIDVVAAPDPVPRVWLGCGDELRPRLREQDVLVEIAGPRNPLKAHSTDTYMRIAEQLASENCGCVKQ